MKSGFPSQALDVVVRAFLARRAKTPINGRQVRAQLAG